MKRKSRKKQLPSSVKGLLLFLCILAVFLFSLFRMDNGQKEEGRRQLEEVLRLSAMACYAAEGIYPPTLDYLSQNYGVLIDEERYAVIYENFAENIMPSITVVNLS